MRLSSSRLAPPEKVLLARLHTLYTQLNDAQRRRRTAEYERLGVEFQELAVAYNTLVDATQGVNRTDGR